MKKTHWIKNSIFYSLDIETFFDSDNDGIGDIRGLTQKLDYLYSLGINCIWLLPFYPSPNRDNGYDVMDYYGVDQRLGTPDQFKEFIAQAHAKGIQLIIDLVVNHTSHEHPWFQEARRDRRSPFRDYYVWSDEAIEFEKERLMLSGEVETMWTYDELAQQYYLHRFYKEQPDLNIANPAVREEILKIIDHWLTMGVDGFRIDAAEILIEPYGLANEQKVDLSFFLDEMRDHIHKRNAEAILLAEANVTPDKMDIYIEDGQRMHMLFNFFLNQHMFLSLATNDAKHLQESMRAMPPVHETDQWLNFLRHHDELSLTLLSDKKQKKVFERFAPDQNMRIFGKGIRRRLAPILQYDLNYIQLSYSLLFSMNGAPLIRYGDDIAMGDDLSLEGRKSVRTPMEWEVVLKQQEDPGSLLNWLKNLTRLRKEFNVIGTGKLNFEEEEDGRILFHSIRSTEQEIFFIHNLSDDSIEVRNSTSHKPNIKLKNRSVYSESRNVFILPSYDYVWFTH